MFFLVFCVTATIIGYHLRRKTLWLIALGCTRRVIAARAVIARLYRGGAVIARAVVAGFGARADVRFNETGCRGGAVTTSGVRTTTGRGISTFV